jgi:hypothetical protein
MRRGGARRRPVAVVAPHDAGGAPRHEVVDQQFEAAERHAGGQQQMSRVEEPFFAGVEQRNLAAVMQLPLQLGGAPPLYVASHSPPPRVARLVGSRCFVKHLARLRRHGR